MVTGLFRCHVLDDIRSPTVACFEIMPWICRRGHGVLPIIKEAVGASPIYLLPRDVQHDCVLFLDIIDEERLSGFTHNLIQIDPLDLPTHIRGHGNRKGGAQI